MPVVVEKRCKSCGSDVSRAKRSKDAAGNYYCEPCLTAVRGRHAPLATVAVMTAEPSASGKTCANCKVAVGALQQTWDWQGHQVCWSCRESLRMDAEERERERELAAAEVSARQAAEAEARRRTAVTEASLIRIRRRELLTGLFCVLFGVAGVIIGPVCNDQDTRKFGLYGGGLALVVGVFALAKYRRVSGGSIVQGLRRDLLPAVGTGIAGSAFSFLLLAIVLGLLVLPFMTAGLGCWLAGLLLGANNPLGLIGAVAGFLGGGFASLVLFLWAKEIERGKCPACQTWFRSVVEQSDVVGQDVRTVEGTRDVQVREGMFTFGKVIANLKVPTSRTVVTNQYLVQRRCRACGHRWATRQ
jgi:hypothetical protein